MKKRWKFGLLLTLLLLFGMQMTVMAAGETVAINSCYIEGDQVKVMASGKIAASDDGNYYLFELKAYEAGVGARTDYCASAPKADAVLFATPLQLDTAASKLYSRFVVTVLRGGQFVPVSTEMYILNPEAVAKASTTSIAEVTGNKKGVYCQWVDAKYLSDLGAGYVILDLNTADFFDAGGVSYTYNGKTYQFNAIKVGEIDKAVSLFRGQNVDVVAKILNGYSDNRPATADMIYPEAIVGKKASTSYFAINVDSPVALEKYEAFLSFIAERYNGGYNGSIHNYLIGNEVNASDSWHYAGEIPVQEFARRYAKEFRVSYNAIKSHNLGANVYIDVEHAWTHDYGPTGYGSKAVLDVFAAEITKSGNINWGLSFHPYPAPLTQTRFWTQGPLAGMISNSEKTKFITPTNMEIVTNYMMKPQMLAPSGAVRNILIGELGFSSAGNGNDEGAQAAALVYAFKKIQANPYIKGVLFAEVKDNPGNEAQGMANGFMRSDGTMKPAYNAFKMMNVAGMEEYLPYYGASSWAQLGVQ